MRTQGVERFVAAPPAPRRRFRRPSLVVVCVGVAALGVVAAGAVLWRVRNPAPASAGALGALPEGTLRATLAARGVAPDEIVLPMEAGADVQALAREAGTGTAVERTRALATAIRRLVETGGGQLKTPGLYVAVPPRTANELAVALRACKAGRVRSVEAGLLLVAAARASGIAAVAAEAFRLAPGRAADPSGAAGYLVAAVYEGRIGDGMPSWVDPFGADVVEATPLDDGAAVGFFLATRALGLLAEDPRSARRPYQLAEAAVLAASLPVATLLGANATITASAGSPAEAVGVARRALAARTDAPRRYLLASLLVQVDAVAEAKRELDAAEAADSSLPSLLLSRASAAVVDGKLADAHGFLDRAFAVAPDAPSAHALAAMLAAREQADSAEKSWRASVAADPDEVRLRAALYNFFVQAGRGAEAAAVRDEALRTARNPDFARELFASVVPAPDAGAAPVTP